MSAPVIKIRDIAYGRLRAPDLDAMEAFGKEFGFAVSARTPTALYMRGTDPMHHIHITEKGDPGFVSIAYLAAGEDDLKRIAKMPGASGVENIDEPGGGKRVRLREPNNGFLVEVVHGMEKPAALEVKPRPLNWTPEVLKTVGDPERLQFGPSRVKRLSHAVLSTPHLKPTLKWFRENFGLLITDELYRGTPDDIVGSFNRLDRGNELVDHHVLNCYHMPVAGMQHLSFEVQDVDDLFIGHNHLMRIKRYEHMRGVGYHPPGGQVFDYWLNDWGQMHEHWITTRRFTAASATNILPAPDVHDPTSRFANTLAKPVTDWEHAA